MNVKKKKILLSVPARASLIPASHIKGSWELWWGSEVPYLCFTGQWRSDNDCQWTGRWLKEVLKTSGIDIHTDRVKNTSILSLFTEKRTVPQSHRRRVETQTGWYHPWVHIFWPDAFLLCSHCPRFSEGEHWGRTSRRICPWKGCRSATRTIHTWLGRHRRAPQGLKKVRQTPAGKQWSGSVCGTGPCGQSWCRVRRRRTGRSQRWSHKCGRNCRSRATTQRQKGRAPHTEVWWRPSRAGQGSASSETTQQTGRPGSQTENQLAPPETKRAERRM